VSGRRRAFGAGWKWCIVARGDTLILQAPDPTFIERRMRRRATRGTRMSADIDSRRLIFPGLAGLYQKGSPYAYAFMRFATGAVLVPHGIQKFLYLPMEKFAPNIAGKGLPFPELLGYVTYFTESVAAICLAIGLFTRVAAAMIWIEMAVIITVFNWQFGYFWTNRGVEYALLWLLLCTAIIFRGGGRYSVDHLIGKEI
jgi:putative oxidoreductase